MYRMIHPDHGAMTAYSASERQGLESRGWKVQTPEEFQALLAAKRGALTQADGLLNEVLDKVSAEPLSKPRGRPPKAR